MELTYKNDYKEILLTTVSQSKTSNGSGDKKLVQKRQLKINHI